MRSELRTARRSAYVRRPGCSCVPLPVTQTRVGFDYMRASSFAFHICKLPAFLTVRFSRTVTITATAIAFNATTLSSIYGPDHCSLPAHETGTFSQRCMKKFYRHLRTSRRTGSGLPPRPVISLVLPDDALISFAARCRRSERLRFSRCGLLSLTYSMGPFVHSHKASDKWTKTK